MTKKAYVACTGCPESRIDSARVQEFLKRNGWNIINDLKEADLIIFRACGLTGKTAEESLQIIKTIKANKKDDSQLIVWGCLPKIDPEALKTEYNGVTFSEKEIELLNKILEAKEPIQNVVANYIMPVSEPRRPTLNRWFNRVTGFMVKPFSDSRSASIFHIKVSTGCLGNCSFCAVRKSRGVVQSKSIDRILAEFRDGLAKGFKYFSLLATDLGAYGRDLGYNLVDLLNEMIKERGDYKISLRNVNPYHLIEMFEELRPIFSSGKIWFLSSAVESGSNRILELMQRKYKIQDIKRVIKMLKKEYPNVVLRTQIMVGFPTETEEDFRESMHLLDELEFDWIEVYKFSSRLGTKAAKMDGQVPTEIKEARFRKMTFKAMTQRPHKKLTKTMKSYIRSYFEHQDWTPPI